MDRVLWEGEDWRIEERIEPIWFGLWHRKTYWFITPHAELRCLNLDEAEEMIPVFGNSLP